MFKIVKDYKRRILFAKYEKQRKVLLSIIRNVKLNKSTRQHAYTMLLALPRNSSLSRVRNRCIITGRSRGIVADFKLSRPKFRELASNGQLSGVKKSSW